MLKSQEIFNIITICLKLRNFIFESSIHIRKVQNVVFSIVFIDSFLNSLWKQDKAHQPQNSVVKTHKHLHNSQEQANFIPILFLTLYQAYTQSQYIIKLQFQIIIKNKTVCINMMGINRIDWDLLETLRLKQNKMFRISRLEFSKV